MNDQVELRNELLSTLHRGGAWAYWWTDHKRESLWWQTGKPAPLPAGKLNWYFGVHPVAHIPEHTYQSGARAGQVKPPSETRASVNDITAINCLFAEFDAKDFAGGKEACFTHVLSLDPPASAVVDSGGGYHAYWLLDGPNPVGPANREAIRALQARWVGHMGGDDGAKDLARVLRVPGTRNFKDKYAPAYPEVRFEWFDGTRYALAQLWEFLPPEPERQAAAAAPVVELTPEQRATRIEKYVQTALQAERQRVASAPAGQRHVILRGAAIRLGTLAGAEAISQADAEGVLLDACGSWLDGNARATIAAGLAHGLARPRKIELTAMPDPQAEARQAFDFVVPAPRLVTGGNGNGNGHKPQAALAAVPTVTTAPEPLPGVQVNNRQLREITADVLDILQRAGSDRHGVFVRGGLLSRVVYDERKRASVRLLDESGVAGALSRACNFFSVRQGAGGTPYQRAENPPAAVVRDVIALGVWPLDPLEAVVEAPIMRQDGSILDAPGYDARTGLYYAPTPDLDWAGVPERPSRYQVEQSMQMLVNLVSDFPFTSAAGRANYLGLLLTPVLRQYIRGHVPMALIDATGQGTGKTLLSELVSILVTGNDPMLLNMPYQGEEWAKTITTSLLAGRPVIVLDNVGREIYADELAQVLTADTWHCRILGTNQTASVPHRAVWIANGNNIKVRGDFASRCYWIRLNSGTSRPWKRSDFQIADIKAHVRANRGAIIAAVLTLARAWHLAGQPARSAPQAMRSYTEWARVIGGVLEFAGEAAFLANAEEFYTEVDQETPEWERFLLALQDRFPSGREFTVAQACDAITGDAFQKSLSDVVPQSLGESDDGHGNLKSNFRSRLGRAFGQRVDTRYGDSQVRIVRGPLTRSRAASWRILAGDEQ